MDAIRVQLEKHAASARLSGLQPVDHGDLSGCGSAVNRRAVGLSAERQRDDMYACGQTGSAIRLQDMASRGCFVTCIVDRKSI